MTYPAPSGPKRILVVDDDLLNRKVLSGLLTSLGHQAILAESGLEALKLMDASIDLVLMDVMMPGMDGYEVTRRIRAMTEYAELPVIIVTTLSGMADRLKAVECGANDFIAKPIDMTELQVRTTSLLHMKESRDAVKRYQADLEEMVQQRTRELQTALDTLRQQRDLTQAAHMDAIRCLAAAAEFKDEDTANHLVRMSRFSGLVGSRLGLSEDEVVLIQAASPMHDVGKIGVPDAILLKPGKLDAQEWEIMKQHTLIGARILGDSPSAILQAGKVIALTHHERWDGTGYPKGLAGEDIPLMGRICAVADVFDALTSRRPYKEAFSVEKSLAILREGRGSQFDARVLDCFFDCLTDVLDTKQRFADEPLPRVRDTVG